LSRPGSGRKDGGARARPMPESDDRSARRHADHARAILGGPRLLSGPRRTLWRAPRRASRGGVWNGTRDRSREALEERAMPESKSYPYATHLNVLHEPLEVVDVQALVNACTDPWYNRTLCEVNASVVRLGVIQGEYHWHKHERDDEFFYVVEGRLVIDLEGRSVELSPRQGFVVPKGVTHRTRT